MAGVFRFIAELTLLRTEEGGRHHGVLVGYRPDWVFDGCDLGYCMGSIVTLERDRLEPGETQKVELRIIRRDRPELLSDFIRVDQEFSTMEGARRVAHGRIVEVIEKSVEAET